VPDLLVAEGRLGVRLDEPVAEARAALEQAVREACEADVWLRDHPVTVEWWGGQFASGRLPAASDLLDRVQSAHSEVTGGRGQATWGAPYGSDLRLLTASAASPRSTTARGTSRSRTGRTSRYRSRRCSPARGPSLCWRWTSAGWRALHLPSIRRATRPQLATTIG
jgi:acetylornithine deacetylase/succinyl-diaminopimelate desuccinylase-like protein